jgi:DNA polymerase III epsilon subunit-like protein
VTLTLPRLVRENTFCVLDLESTGLSTSRDQIVQIALAQIDHGLPRFRMTAYVRPSIPVSDAALAVHDIGWEILEHAHPFAGLADDVVSFIGKRCLVGFGIGRFDHPMLARQLGEAGRVLNLPVLDVLTWERKLSKLLPGGLEKGAKHNLRAAAERWNVNVLEGHDALEDCRMAWNVLLTMAARFPELGDLELAAAVTTKETEPLPAALAL